MRRQVKPELLDGLPHDHPDALRNRRDIRLFNWLMGNYRWLRRNLEQRARPGDRALEIGAGAGDFARYLRRQKGWISGLELDGLDVCPPPADWNRRRRWWRSDVVGFDRWEAYEVAVANLLLHQFEPEALGRIGVGLRSGPRLILACEVARRRRHLWQLKAAPLLGLSRVSRHDAPTSVEAGFKGMELPRWLGLLEEEGWSVSVRTGFLGQYALVAERRDL